MVKRRIYKKPEVIEHDLDIAISMVMSSLPSEGGGDFETGHAAKKRETIFNNEDELLPDRPRY